jgi:hypothetical protein
MEMAGIVLGIPGLFTALVEEFRMVRIASNYSGDLATATLMLANLESRFVQLGKATKIADMEVDDASLKRVMDGLEIAEKDTDDAALKRARDALTNHSPTDSADQERLARDNMIQIHHCLARGRRLSVHLSADQDPLEDHVSGMFLQAPTTNHSIFPKLMHEPLDTEPVKRSKAAAGRIHNFCIKIKRARLVQATRWALSEKDVIFQVVHDVQDLIENMEKLYPESEGRRESLVMEEIKMLGDYLVDVLSRTNELRDETLKAALTTANEERHKPGSNVFHNTFSDNCGTSFAGNIYSSGPLDFSSHSGGPSGGSGGR